MHTATPKISVGGNLVIDYVVTICDNKIARLLKTSRNLFSYIHRKSKNVQFINKTRLKLAKGKFSK